MKTRNLIDRLFEADYDPYAQLAKDRGNEKREVEIGRQILALLSPRGHDETDDKISQLATELINMHSPQQPVTAWGERV